MATLSIFLLTILLVSFSLLGPCLKERPEADVRKGVIASTLLVGRPLLLLRANANARAAFDITMADRHSVDTFAPSAAGHPAVVRGAVEDGPVV